MHLSLSAKLGNKAPLFSASVRDYFSRLDAAGLRVGKYDAANARLIDRLKANGGNFWPDSGAFNAMAGYLYPGNGEDLIPLHPNHDAGTLNAFVTGDWNAVTGLKGDGSTKYVDSNRNNNADGQNDACVGVYVNTENTIPDGSLIRASGRSTIFSRPNSFMQFRLNRNTINVVDGDGTETGYVGMTRDNAINIKIRLSGANTTTAQTSINPEAEPWQVLASSDARLSLYHIGPNLSGTGELAKLDSILTDWQTDLANA